MAGGFQRGLMHSNRAEGGRDCATDHLFCTVYSDSHKYVPIDTTRRAIKGIVGGSEASLLATLTLFHFRSHTLHVTEHCCENHYMASEKKQPD